LLVFAEHHRIDRHICLDACRIGNVTLRQSTSAPQQVTLTNSGDQPLTSVAATVTGDFTAVNNCAAVLQAHATCAIAVSYAPTLVGAESGTLTITDEFRTQKIALTGTGIAPPGVSAIPKSINFGGCALATTSPAQTVTVTNSGGYALSNLAAAVTTGFAVASSNCPSTLALGKACQLGITFSPAAAGPATGTLTISAATLTSPLTVALTGQGNDFSIAISGSTSAIITSGQTATFAPQLEGLGGTSGTVALTCTGAPQNATCALNPNSIAVTGLNTSSVTATLATGVATASTSSALDRDPKGHDTRWRAPNWKTAAPLLALALPLWCASLRRTARRPRTLILLATAVLILAGCGVAASSGSVQEAGSGSGGGSGGGGGGQNQTPSGTYTITITGVMSNITHNVQLNLTVQ
jgi:hypothetical protein